MPRPPAARARCYQAGSDSVRGLWDGKSKGTVNNVVNLSRDHKPVVVYVAPTRQFRTIKTFGDLKDLLAQGDSDRVERIISELHLNDMPQRAAG